MTLTDDALLLAASHVVDSVLVSLQRYGGTPEELWLVLALASDAAERGLLYANSSGVVNEGAAAAEYAAAAARLARLLEEVRGAHGEAASEMDAALGVTRGAPQ